MDRSGSPAPPRPRALIFDLDNTLYPYAECHEPALAIALAALAAQFNASAGDVRAAYDEARKSTKERLGERASAHSRLLYFLRAFETLGYGPRPDNALVLEQTYWREFLARMSLADGFADIFNRAKARKIPIALATELTAAIQFRKLIVLGLAETFDCVVTSEECAGEKCSGDVYALLKEKMELSPGPHLWVIGDGEGDMLAKKHLGATTIFANLHGAAPTTEKADHTVTTVSQLAWLIERSFDER